MNQWMTCNVPSQAWRGICPVGIGLLGAIATLTTLTPQAMATPDLQQQLAIPLNNGTRGNARDEADRLTQLGRRLASISLLGEAVTTWQQALKLYQDINDTEAMGVVYGHLATAYHDMARYRESEDAMRRQLGATRTRRDFQGQIYAVNNLGRALAPRERGMPGAEELFTEGLVVSTSIPDYDGRAVTYDSKGQLALRQGNFEQAEQYFALGLAPNRSASAINGMGAVYQAQQEYDRAMRTYQIAMRIAETNGDVTNQFRAMDGMIATLNDSKQYTKSAEMLGRRLDMALAQNNTREEMLSLRYLGQFHQWAGNYPIAKRYYQEALTVASQLDDSLQAGQLRVRLASFEIDNFSPPER